MKTGLMVVNGMQDIEIAVLLNILVILRKRLKYLSETVKSIYLVIVL